MKTVFNKALHKTVETKILLVGCQEEHPAHKNLSDMVLAQLSSGEMCK